MGWKSKFRKHMQWTTFYASYSKPDLFESQNARAIVRNGIPPKYMNKFILRLFDINKDENINE